MAAAAGVAVLLSDDYRGDPASEQLSLLNLSQEKKAQHEKSSNGKTQTSATGTRTQVARVKAEYPSQLDYSGSDAISKPSANTHNAWRQLQAQWLALATCCHHAFFF